MLSSYIVLYYNYKWFSQNFGVKTFFLCRYWFFSNQTQGTKVKENQFDFWFLEFIKLFGWVVGVT